jgi:hypothetical protein
MINSKNTVLNILNTDMAEIACRLDMLVENPDVCTNTAIAAELSAIRTMHLSAWERLEATCE